MAADQYGNDITAVGIPMGGFLALAPIDTTLVAPADGAKSALTLPTGFWKAGLITDDGGFEWELEPDGKAIEFWQPGYSIPSGIAKATLTAKLAQYDDQIRSFLYGATPDANGYMLIDAGGSALQYRVFTEELFKNGVVRRRQAAIGQVTKIKADKSKQGDVLGNEVEITINPSPELGNKHLGEWLIKATA